MPGRKKQHPHAERAENFEEIQNRLDECINLIGMIASSLDEAGNPPEMGEAWMTIATNLIAQRNRACDLAR